MIRSARPLRTRQALFFVVAIVLPCAVLVLLTLRMLVQDRELGEKRIADAERRVVQETRQALLLQAERLRRAASDATAAGSPSPAVIVGRMDGSRLDLPWDDPPAQRRAVVDLADARFRSAVAHGERLEFSGERFSDAARSYQQVAWTATSPTQRASASLLAARVFVKARQPADAAAMAQHVLDTAAELVDDQGIPFAVYAARILVDTNHRSDAIAGMLGQVVASPVAGPPAIYMIRDIAARIASTDALNRAVAARVRDLEQALALRAALPTLGLVAGDSGDGVWLTFGPPDNLWLVSLAGASGGSTITALRAADVLARAPADVQFVSGNDTESLAPSFPTLRVTMAPATLAALAADNNTQRPFYLAALVVVISVALFGAYLFWRDVQRDIRVAELRSQFVSSVSHELKTPLTAIRMFAETLLIGGPGRAQVQQEYLETIVNESERLTRLLNNVLDFSKIEGGNKLYHLAPHPLPDVVRAAAKAMQYPFAQQGLDLRIDIDDSLPLAAIDPDAIQQAVLNLLSNAMKYSGDGRVVELSLRREGNDAVITVTDGGFGIPLDEQRKIFEKFYRVANATTERIAGTGLGLTLVDHVTRGHSGTVTVESGPGQGSKFAIRLPLLDTAGTAPHAAGALA